MEAFYLGVFDEAKRPGVDAASTKNIAVVYAMQGKAGEAVKFLKKAIELGEDPKRIFFFEPKEWFDNIRDTKEFQDFTRDVGK